MSSFRVSVLAAAAALSLSTLAQAALVDVTVTVLNRAPANSISFAPLHVGFNNGSFDAFNNGSIATTPIISVAEGGGGEAWQAAFAAADPTAVRGTVGGLLQPGQTQSKTFRVDTAVNPYFTFGAMAVPSNDFFIGNDDPMAYKLFDALGYSVLSSIEIQAWELWDAGSELFDPAAAAFVGNNDLRTAQNGVVSRNFEELTGFNGLTTDAGYVFNSQLSADTDIYRIDFSVQPVPEPETYALMLGGLLAVGFAARRRRSER
jgi:PEP-CTERM motif